jgi:NADH-quinone oxidoreductase subunit A
LLRDYLPILIVLVIVIAVGIGMVFASALLGPKKPSPEKNAPYECGIIPAEDARKSVWVRFYMIAMLFILFDIETVFLYPWAVIYRKLGLFGLGEMATFLVILIVGYAYAWKKGALSWD